MAVQNENTNAPNSAPQVAEFRPRRHFISRKIFIALALIIILLVAGILIYIYRPGREPAIPTNITPTQKAQYLADQGEYDAAQAAWQRQLAGAGDQQTTLGIYYQQSALALKFKRYDDAKKYAEQAKTLAPKSPTPYVALAQLAQAQGDKSAARQYWQQAIAQLDPASPTYNLIKRDYQSSLDSLK